MWPFAAAAERGDEIVVHTWGNNHSCRRSAVLTCVEETGERNSFSGCFQIGIVKDHDGGLAAEFKVEAFEAVRGRFSNLHAGPH